MLNSSANAQCSNLLENGPGIAQPADDPPGTFPALEEYISYWRRQSFCLHGDGDAHSSIADFPYANATRFLHEWVKTTRAEMNDARLRMTRIPKSADLILNKVSGAPGFWIGNVIVMAGVPSIMQAMLDEVAKLKIGVRMLSETVRADAREGDIGMQLGEIAKANPEVAIGSYPFFDPQHGPNTNVVLRAHDAKKLAQAKREVEEMLERVRRAQSKSA